MTPGSIARKLFCQSSCGGAPEFIPPNPGGGRERGREYAEEGGIFGVGRMPVVCRGSKRGATGSPKLPLTLHYSKNKYKPGCLECLLAIILGSGGPLNMLLPSSSCSPSRAKSNLERELLGMPHNMSTGAAIGGC